MKIGSCGGERQRETVPLILFKDSSISSGKSHGQRSLAGYSPWGCKESDMTERLTFALLIYAVNNDILLYLCRNV